MRKIVQKEDPILRGTADPVPLKDIVSPKIRELVFSMKEAMHAENDAVGIAAPQIGISLRIFIVSGIVFQTQNQNKDEKEKISTELMGDAGKIQDTNYPPSHRTIGEQGELQDLVCINPEIIKTSKKERVVEEGCLSVRWLYGDVSRAEKVILRAYDARGKLFTRGASGLLAQIFQHEVDHLNGKLFIDKAQNIREIKPEGAKNKGA